MKKCLKHIFQAMLLGSIVSAGGLFAMNGVPGDVPALPLVSTKTEQVMDALHKWRGTATVVGGVAAYYGYNIASSYFPDLNLAPIAVIGLAGLGAKYVPHMFGKGMKKVFADANGIAERDGLKGITKAFGKGTFAGAAEGVKESLVDPVVEGLANRLRPAVSKVVDDLKKEKTELVSEVKSGAKRAGVTLLTVGAGLIGLWYGVKFLNSYYERSINKPRLDVVVKKASQQGTMGTLTRQIIVEEGTRDRLNLFLHTNLKVKQSLLGGNDDARFRTALLWGPAGCGKRMFAQEMANFARMDYYEVPWSSFQKFKEGDATRAIEEFFKHEVLKSQNGAVVYIDNAQMLFSSTLATTGPSSSSYAQIRSALIEQIESRSPKFLVVFGMNGKPSLAQDTALIVDDIIEVSLPKFAERKRLLKYYRDLYFKVDTISEDTDRAVNTMLDDHALDTLAKRLDKASASELASFMNTLKIEAMLPTSEGLTPSLVAQLVARSEHRFEEAIA